MQVNTCEVKTYLRAEFRYGNVRHFLVCNDAQLLGYDGQGELAKAQGVRVVAGVFHLGQLIR